ncbi:MAG: serine/threonine protein kinase [Sandaracinaceae bacterium]|nr:serine/threonine protein kinase [Sandaracinaceae bacterium]
MPPTRTTEHEDRVLRFRQALRFALVTWPAFVLVDLGVALGIGGRVWVFLATRALGALALGGAALVLRRDASARTVWAIDAALTTFLAAMVSVQAHELAGLGSPLAMGVMLLLIGHAALLGDAWRRALVPIGLAAAAYPLTTLALGALTGTLGAQLADPSVASRFALDVLFLAGGAALALAGGHAVWQLRRQVFRTRALGRWRLVDKIGEGGMGEVWRAHHHALGREVAIKILSREKRACPDAVARFEREASMMASLRHPNAVSVFDYGVTEDGLFYYAMELLEGEDLSCALSRMGRLDPARAVEWIQQAAEGVAEAHRAGIVHRDLKPENLFVTRSGDGSVSIKVLDFGLARLTRDSSPQLTREGWVVGTPATIAPELVRGEPADARSDVYALGVVLYQMLAGVRPFEGEPATVLRAKVKLDPVKPSLHTGAWIPPHLEAVVMRCLAREPDARYPNAAALADALARCPLRGVSVETEIESWDDITCVEGRSGLFLRSGLIRAAAATDDRHDDALASRDAP